MTDPNWVLFDDFKTDRAAGAVNGTAAEPVGGNRTVVDTNNVLSIVSGRAEFATGGVAVGNPGLWYPSMSLDVGLILQSKLNFNGVGFEFGLDASAAGNVYNGIRGSATSLQARTANGTITVGALAASTEYQFTVIQRGVGFAGFVKGGTYTNWTLVWVSDLGVSFAPFPGLVVTGGTAAFSVDFIRSPDLRWLPVPLVSDGFSTTNSDGLGHAETSGIGSGGSGLAWTQQVGTWTIASGKANASALSGGIAIATINSGKSDVIATARVTRSAGVAGVVVRYVDASNYIYAVHNGTNAQLIKRVAGVETTLVNVVATYSANAELRVISDGTKHRLFYNNVAIGTEQTVSDSALLTPTLHGICTTDTGNLLDDSVMHNRGTDGSYNNTLDVFYTKNPTGIFSFSGLIRRLSSRRVTGGFSFSGILTSGGIGSAIKRVVSLTGRWLTTVSLRGRK